MIYSALVFFFILALVAVNGLTIRDFSQYTFEDFEAEFSKTYSCESARKTARVNFNHNLAQIRAHNAKPHISYAMGVNDKSDLTTEELIARYTGYNMGMASTTLKGASVFKATGKALPDAVDWRSKNAVTPVKDQGGCGSCWAFSATESIESAVILQLSKTLVLSPQDVVDCTPNPLHCGGTGGCNGATPELAFDWVGENGIALDSAYPYKGRTGTCQNVTRSVRVGSWSKIAPNDAQSLMEAVATYGPISVSVAASPWGSYSSGIYTGCPTTDIDINHAVQLVGYGTENGTGYWIVRNSWGASWGEAGYIRLYRGTKEVCGDDNTPSDGSGCTGGPDKITVCGSCGIWYDNSFPLDGLLL